jgi:hypothetical protein
MTLVMLAALCGLDSARAVGMGIVGIDDAVSYCELGVNPLYGTIDLAWPETRGAVRTK